MHGMKDQTPKTIVEFTGQFAAEEREYLHALANPLAIATGMLEAYREDLSREGMTPTESQERKLGKMQTALDRIADLIRERRSKMIALQGGSST